ncbi:MAG: ABC transporter substrate-binding protein [Halobacteria archaeon]|nr:ABC transporter substrate-binding protein [Halobacteria archaeon]
MARDTDRRKFLKGIGAAGVAGLAGCTSGGNGNGGGGEDTQDAGGDGGGQNETTDDTGDTGDGGGDGGPDVLNIIGYPQSGIQIFKDFYTNFEGSAEIIVPDGLRDGELPQRVGADMSNVTGTAPGAAGPNQEAFEDLYTDEYGSEPSVFTSNTYDATAVLLLANAAAGENDGEAVKMQMRRVANPPGEKYGPGEIAEAAEAAANGEEINYEGASSTVDFDDRGDPTSATYDVWKFADEGTEVVDSVSFTGQEPAGEAADESPGGLGRTLQVGILLPQTGDLAPLGNPMIDAAMLPINEINNSDVDLEVDHSVQDTQTSQSAGISGAEALVNAGYPAVVGAASSGINVPVSKNVLIPNGVVGCSPSSTALSVSFLEDDGYIFRTAPSDLLQGQAMARVASDRLGASTASTFYVNNSYGQQLSEQFSDNFTEEYGGEVYHKVSFEKQQSSYTAKLEQALSPQ